MIFNNVIKKNKPVVTCYGLLIVNQVARIATGELDEIVQQVQKMKGFVGVTIMDNEPILVFIKAKYRNAAYDTLNAGYNEPRAVITILNPQIEPKYIPEHVMKLLEEE